MAYCRHVDFGDSRSAMYSVFSVLGDAGYWVYFFAMISAVMRNLHAKGTRGRYVFSSLYRPVALAGPILWMINLVTDVLGDKDGKFAYIGLDVLFLALSILQYRWFRSDEDDWWTGLGGRIKNRVAGLLSNRRRQLVFGA